MAGLATKLIHKGEVVKAFTIDAGAASRWTTGAPYGRGVCENPSVLHVRRSSISKSQLSR